MGTLPHSETREGRTARAAVKLSRLQFWRIRLPAWNYVHRLNPKYLERLPIRIERCVAQPGSR
jgi:hypothetical protein